MYIKITLIQRLISDVQFRNELAEVLGVTSQAIYTMAKRYINDPFPHSNFTRIAVIEFFEKYDYNRDHFLVQDKSAV